MAIEFRFFFLCDKLMPIISIQFALNPEPNTNTLTHTQTVKVSDKSLKSVKNVYILLYYLYWFYILKNVGSKINLKVVFPKPTLFLRLQYQNI